MKLDSKVAIVAVLALNLALVTNLQTAQAQLDFESPTYNFRISNLPAGWVVEEGVVGNDRVQRMMETMFNFEHIGMICKATQAIPAIGGNHDCELYASGPNPTPENPSEIIIYRWSQLKDRAEFVNVQQATPNDVISLYLMFSRELSGTINPTSVRVQFAVANEEDTTVRIASTNQTVPAKLATLTTTVYSTDSSATVPDHVDNQFGLFFVSPDGNTGYSAISSRWDAETNPNMPAEIAQIFQSFEYISPIAADAQLQQQQPQPQQNKTNATTTNATTNNNSTTADNANNETALFEAQKDRILERINASETLKQQQLANATTIEEKCEIDPSHNPSQCDFIAWRDREPNRNGSGDGYPFPTLKEMQEASRRD